MHNAAEEYGRALFDLAAEGDGDVIERDAKAVLAAFTAAPEYIRLLENPGIPEEKRRAALTRAQNDRGNWFHRQASLYSISSTVSAGSGSR